MPILEELKEILGTLDGHTGVYARPLDPDTGADAEIAIEADRSYTLASVVKLPLLIHLLRLVDQGRVGLDDRIELRESDRVVGSGIIQFLDAGLKPTVRDLMRLMMMISDNEATDLLLALTSKQAAQDDMHALGYTSFHMPHSIREMLASFHEKGLDLDWAGTRAAFMDPDYAPPADPEGNSAERGDRATPRDLCNLLADFAAGKLASEGSTEVGIGILKDCQTNSRIPWDLPKGTAVAHKTGTLNRRTNDVGIVYAPAGAYVIALMNHGEEDERKASATLAKASRAIFDHFGAGVAD